MPSTPRLVVADMGVPGKAGNSVSPRAEGTSRFLAVYDWDALLPDIFDRMVNGETLIGICADPAMPSPGAVTLHVQSHPDKLARYEAIKVARAEAYGEHIDALLMDVADPANFASDKSDKPRAVAELVRAFNLRMGQLSPRYRDRRVEVSGQVNHAHTHTVGDKLVRARERAIKSDRAPIDVTPTSKRIA